MRSLAALAMLGLTSGFAQAAMQTVNSPALRVQVDTESRQELLSIRIDGAWAPVLSASSSVFVRTPDGMRNCVITGADPVESGLRIRGDCGIGTFDQDLCLNSEEDVLDVSTHLQLTADSTLLSVEDRYNFLPALHKSADEHAGPLDFVWSQNIKRESGDLIPANSFKSPALMMQQGRIFAALMPHVNLHHAEVRALDLDVTGGTHPWMAYGAIPSQPHDHSYFRRDPSTPLKLLGREIEYSYSLVLSDQPVRLGYRRVVRRLWQTLGHPALLASAAEQQNVLRPELRSFDSWRKDAWQDYAGRIYIGFPCGEKQCGTLKSDRNYLGEWSHPEADAWFNAWFQTLRTAYGWYLDGRRENNRENMARAESILNLALSAPQKNGLFPTIFLVDRRQWVPGDGWASYADSYHAFSMSWTAYWMLRWAEDLVPDRKEEILRFVRAYADFLCSQQHPDGVIPSWYDASTLKPRTEFRDFNAETAPSALLLATLGADTGELRYTQAAERAMAFIVREVLPRQRWFDFETYLSCARKDYSFFDSWTAQYPQNNLAEIQAPAAMLELYRVTHNPEYLSQGANMLDYLLLTQQVWNNVLFTPDLLGGFTTQNTDQEWSDARQSYAAMVLAGYYQATGRIEYLERAIAAARSTFAVAPWENWAHTGYRDEPGALTGFHWGTGSAMDG
jgi:rhamnogalacturonyl hydrolase YesR